MRVYEITLDDPALRTILDDGALPDGATPVHDATDLVLIGVEEGVPVGFVNGVTVQGHPILEQMGIRPGFRGQGRSRAFFDAFEVAMRARRHGYFLTAIAHRGDLVEQLVHLLIAWGCTPYASDDRFQWWRRVVPTLAPTKEG